MFRDVFLAASETKYYIFFSDRRIEEPDISKAFEWLNKDVTQAFICGPSNMITDMQDILIKLNVPKNKIHFESWWRPK